MAALFVPSRLRSICVRKVVESSDIHTEKLSSQPKEIKDLILLLMSKRGLLQDSDVGKLLHEDVLELDLSESNISDEGLKEVCICKKLLKLDLNASKGIRKEVTSSGISILGNHCLQLQIVFLRRCINVNDFALERLAKCCSNLTQINVEGCSHVTDKSAIVFSKHSCRLSCLNVSKTKVTDKGLCSLSKGCCADVLQEIHCSFCLDVTDIGINSLLDFCSRLQILIFHGCPLTTGQSRERMQSLGPKMKQVTWTIY